MLAEMARHQAGDRRQRPAVPDARAAISLSVIALVMRLADLLEVLVHGALAADEGEAAALGKTAGKDAASAKPTYPALFGLDRSRALAADCIRRANAALEGARLSEGWLAPIADWILHRKN